MKQSVPEFAPIIAFLLPRRLRRRILREENHGAARQNTSAKHVSVNCAVPEHAETGYGRADDRQPAGEVHFKHFV
jgi:hypothetical protein